MSQIYQFKSPSVVAMGSGARGEIASFANGIGRKALLMTDRRGDS